MKNKEIKEEYCKELGYGSFNKYNENDYSKWLEKQLLIHSVGNHVFCPHCGDKRQLKVETDLNSGRVCKSRLCKGK